MESKKAGTTPTWLRYLMSNIWNTSWMKVSSLSQREVWWGIFTQGNKHSMNEGAYTLLNM
jgi:hypothetical protein